jgi:hypothetical protein
VRLAELQRRFWKLVSAPETVDKALPELARADPDIAPVSSWIRASGEEAAQARLNIYANMYFFRLLGVLRDDYPCLVKLIGDDRFHNLVTTYLQVCPSDNPSIRHVGGRLPGFLAGHDIGEPAAADLARLEWERGLAFDAADGPELEAAALAATPAERWGELRFALVPSYRGFEVASQVHLLWQALDRDQEVPALSPRPTEILVWRRGFTVYHRTAAQGERRLLEMVAAGAPFAVLCEELHQAHGDAAVTAAFQLLKSWIDQGILSGIAS